MENVDLNFLQDIKKQVIDGDTEAALQMIDDWIHELQEKASDMEVE